MGGQLGTADASRFLGNLAPGECKVQYWHMSYPRRSNGSTSNDNSGPDPIWGDTNIKTDDLWLEFNVWGRDAAGVSTGSATWRMTMRNEISAMANKIKPNPNGQWFNTNTATVLPGETITSNGIDYELGVINQGFDNDGDMVPDFNAWLQPVGDPSYDPSCFRLIKTEGLSGVVVNLYRDSNSNGVLDAGEPLLATQTTNGSGLYLFSNLPGNGSRYIVRVNSGTLPAGVTQTGDPSEAGTCVICDDTYSATLNAANVLTADFGYRPFGYASIGDTIWSDNNANGIQEASETGVPGVVVQLYQDQDGDGILDPEDAIVASTTTNASGYYIFEDLAAGNYIVRVATSNFTTGQPLSGRTLTQTSAPHNATQNSYQVSLAAGELFEDADLGYASSVIGDRVWQDNDGDGEQESGEPGIVGVIVYLCTSAPCTSSNDIASDVTDGNGLYEFAGLTARTGANVYVVAVDIATLPVGFTQTGDPDRTSNCAAGGSPACDNRTTLNLNLGQIDRSRDFGYQPTAFIGDTVWIDTNANGVRDPGEAGIGSITVRLCADAGCTTVIATTATDADGYYTFGNVNNGTYFVRVDLTDPQFPAGLTNTYDPDGTMNSTSQVIVSGNQVTSVGGSACTNCSLNVDFGYRYVGSNTVSGTIFFDAQNNGGIYNAGGGDTPFANVTVYLRNNAGLIIATTTTDAAGFYSFTTLPNGTYTVVMDANAPQLDGLTQRSEPDNLNCGACNNTTTFTLNNANLTNQDFGFFGNIDCGDAPASYNTLLANQGPCHMISGTYLGGSAPDAEANGQPEL